jgi:hypothetical protein
MGIHAAGPQRDRTPRPQPVDEVDLLTVLDVKGQIVIFDVAFYDATPETVLDEVASIITSVNVDHVP